MTFGGVVFWVVNTLVLMLLIFKFKSIGKLKRVGMFILFLVGSVTAMILWAGYFGDPSRSAIENLTLNYEKNAKNIKIIAIAEDKTIGESYIVTAGFTDGETNCEITMPVTRTSDGDSWYARKASVNCKN